MQLPDLSRPPRVERTSSTGDVYELFYCPFCFELDELMLHDSPQLDHAEDDLACAWVECYECGANGPGCDTASEAVDGWNNRVWAFTPFWN